MRNHRYGVGTMTDDGWPIGMLPEGSLNVGVGGEQSVPRSGGAARPTDLTDEDFEFLLTEVISELARLQVEAWFKRARGSD